MKLKIKNKVKNNATNGLIKIIRKILKKHGRAGKPTYLGKQTLTKQSGNLFREIKPNFKISNNRVVWDVEMMEYYKYLDEGTSRIQPWFFSEEIMNDSQLMKISEDLLGSAVEETIFDMVSKINKKK